MVKKKKSGKSVKKKTAKTTDKPSRSFSLLVEFKGDNQVNVQAMVDSDTMLNLAARSLNLLSSGIALLASKPATRSADILTVNFTVDATTEINQLKADVSKALTDPNAFVEEKSEPEIELETESESKGYNDDFQD